MFCVVLLGVVYGWWWYRVVPYTVMLHEVPCVAIDDICSLCISVVCIIVHACALMTRHCMYEHAKEIMTGCGWEA